MCWENKDTYIGNETYPITLNFSKDSSNKKLKHFDDIKHGVTKEEYIYIIQQLYYHFTLFYNKFKAEQENVEDLDFEISELQEEINRLTSINNEYEGKDTQ